MKTPQYLDAAKRSSGIQSDYALAPLLGITKQAVSKLRNGHLVMSNTTAAKIARLIGVDPLRVIADAELERGSNDELWKRIRDAAVLFAFWIGAACFGVAVTPPPAAAATLHNQNHGLSAGAARMEYALCNTRRRRQTWLDRLLSVLL